MAQYQSSLRPLDTFSTGSGATTIFDSNQEPRFVELRELRQQITQSINHFVVERRAASVIPKDQREADQLSLDVFEELQDIDMKRSLVVLNVKNWIRHAHTLLDANNVFDRTMLRKMSNYVERVRRHLTNNPFLVEFSVDATRECVLPSLEEVLPPCDSNVDDDEPSDEIANRQKVLSSLSPQPPLLLPPL